ncbi:helix-turn-helix domain-containing protein [Niallia sp.]|uniref:helix-turn-helix domain-containing protein n=1 Tax=Niallia sp. TaxID=2837523 RepID=UPI00289E5982|nr:helix-turn-helix domain-containing protein [Niallia sp.]
MIPFENDRELRTYLENELVFSSEVTELLGCTKEYIHDCVKKGVLEPVKADSKERVFLRSDIIALINRKRK